MKRDEIIEGMARAMAKAYMEEALFPMTEGEAMQTTMPDAVTALSWLESQGIVEVEG